MYNPLLWNRSLLWKTLRQAGFKRSDYSKWGGVEFWEYEKQVDERRLLSCQIWSDGLCRVSSSFDGCGDTPPTEFTHLESFLAAVKTESTRTDSTWYPRGTTHVDKLRLAGRNSEEV